MNNLIGILKIKFFEGPLTLRRPQYPQFGAESSTACPGSWARGPHDAWSYPPRNTEEEGSPSDIFEEIVASWLSIVIQIQLYSINYTHLMTIGFGSTTQLYSINYTQSTILGFFRVQHSFHWNHPMEKIMGFTGIQEVSPTNIAGPQLPPPLFQDLNS